MIDMFLFCFSNYIILVVVSVILGVLWVDDSRSEIKMSMKAAEIESRTLTKEMVYSNLFMISFVRTYLMDVPYSEMIKLMLVGTFGVILLRAVVTNLTTIATIVYVKKQEEKNSINTSD